MNKQSIFTLFAFIMLAGAVVAQPGGEPKAGNKPANPVGETKRWSSEERFAFISECIKEAKLGMSEDSARFYCYCMQEKIEKKYPDPEDAAKITEGEMESEEFQKMVMDCLGGTWDTENREVFISECVKKASTNLGEEKAKTYCECMQFKIEKAYPDPKDINELTAEKLASPEWKKVVKGCLDF